MKLPGIAAAVLTLALASAFWGCGLIQELEGGSGGSSTTTGAGAGASTTPTGVDCGTDPNTSATLCLGNTLCAGITIDTSTYPGCGFRVNGTIVDIECSCSGYLCPLGATTCAEATTMLAAENYSQVCSQAGNGTCAQGTPVASTTAAAGGGSCDTQCRADCGADINCIQLCGC